MVKFYFKNYFSSIYPHRHALPLFTSLLNCLCSYDPVGYGVPYNHLMFSDSREPLVEVALQVLCVTMENDNSTAAVSVDGTGSGTAMDQANDVSQLKVLVTRESYYITRLFLAMGRF